MKIDTETITIWFGGMLIISLLLIALHGNPLTCYYKDWAHEELECYKQIKSNISSSVWKYTILNKTVQSLENQKREEQREQDTIRAAQDKICYLAGTTINKSFDIHKDYGYTCKQLAYINDHFVDHVDQRDGGYIQGSGSGWAGGVGPFGFMIGHSSTSIEGKFYQYVVTQVSATGHLVQSLSYHLDCREDKHNEIIDYYTEAEFVMYYVDHCIEEKRT